MFLVAVPIVATVGDTNGNHAVFAVVGCPRTSSLDGAPPTTGLLDAVGLGLAGPKCWYNLL